jgi:transcriptional regulator with XRE-family HTH domain
MIRQRNSKELSQAELAAMIGKPPSFVGKYELGERRLDIVEVFVILNAMEIDPLAFLGKHIKNLPNGL